MDVTWGMWAEGGGGIQEEVEGVDVTWGITTVGKGESRRRLRGWMSSGE